MSWSSCPRWGAGLQPSAQGLGSQFDPPTQQPGSNAGPITEVLLCSQDGGQEPAGPPALFSHHTGEAALVPVPVPGLPPQPQPTAGPTLCLLMPLPPHAQSQRLWEWVQVVGGRWQAVGHTVGVIPVKHLSPALGALTRCTVPTWPPQSPSCVMGEVAEAQRTHQARLGCGVPRCSSLAASSPTSSQLGGPWWGQHPGPSGVLGCERVCRHPPVSLSPQGIYILIAVGAVMMFVGFLGCYGAIQESQCLLGTVRQGGLGIHVPGCRRLGPGGAGGCV